jgi:hypothetical protein
MRHIVALTLLLVYATAQQSCSNFTVALDTKQGAPSVSSSASGTAVASLNGNVLTVTSLAYTGLTSNITSAHIHAGTVGVTGAIVFNLVGFTPSTSGKIPSNTFSISNDQISTLVAQGYYFNVHTIQNGAGEIRGQLVCKLIVSNANQILPLFSILVLLVLLCF